jgi:hypothetical protein
VSARVLLDPTAETEPAGLPRLRRPASLRGLSVGLLDIAKARGDVFLDRVAERLREEGALVVRFRKPTFTRPAPVDLRQEIGTRCQAVLEALAD